MLALDWWTQMGGPSRDGGAVRSGPGAERDPTGFAVVLTATSRLAPTTRPGPPASSARPVCCPPMRLRCCGPTPPPASPPGSPPSCGRTRTASWLPGRDGGLELHRLHLRQPSRGRAGRRLEAEGAYTSRFWTTAWPRWSPRSRTGSGISWTAPIPLAGGFEKIYSLPADPASPRCSPSMSPSP